MFGELARIESLLAETYRDRVQYELLQNSDDAESQTVDVFVGSDGRVTWSNNGLALSSRDMDALCRSASSAKARGDSIGYRGIGFKSLAGVASRVEVTTAGCSFVFDRRASADLVRLHGHDCDQDDFPLVRIPTEITDGPSGFPGVTFEIKPLDINRRVLGNLDPTALLFLRHVQVLRVKFNNEVRETRVRRDGNRLELQIDGSTSNYTIISHGRATIAIPMDSRAIAQCTSAGRVACFLPLDDPLGIPLIVSGDLLTDPSRTHANTADPSTNEVLQDAATAFAECLSDTNSQLFQRCWDLLLLMQDPRATLAQTSSSTDFIFLSSLREALRKLRLPFSISPFEIPAEDIDKVFPSGAPHGLYSRQNLSTARALRIAFALPSLDVAATIVNRLESLSPSIRSTAAEHIGQMLSATGRRPSPEEQQIIDSAGQRKDSTTGTNTNALSTPTLPPTQHKPAPSEGSFSTVMDRWRTAELSTKDYLNSRGWNLDDVSRQNLGYDLTGSDQHGRPVHLEVKKVDRPDSRFSMTNNEMGVLQSVGTQYLLAIVIGDGNYVRLMLLDPADPAVARERVCRAWEWQFNAWVDHGTFVD